LGRGIQSVQSNIAVNQKRANDLRNDISSSLIRIGGIVYTSYGQKKDPGRLVLSLKESIDNAVDALRAGNTRQGLELVGKVGQITLDLWSEENTAVNTVNAIQQILWELGNLRKTTSELSNCEQRIATDTQILSKLEAKNTDLQSRIDSQVSKTNPVNQNDTRPTQAVDLSALDDAVTLNRWLDLGNRAFANKTEEDAFYRRFPDLLKYRTIAETYSPRTEVLRDRAAASKFAPSMKAANPDHSRLVGQCELARGACLNKCGIPGFPMKYPEYNACVAGCNAAKTSCVANIP
jgi:hypothetical protein